MISVWRINEFNECTTTFFLNGTRTFTLTCSSCSRPSRHFWKSWWAFRLEIFLILSIRCLFSFILITLMEMIIKSTMELVLKRCSGKRKRTRTRNLLVWWTHLGFLISLQREKFLTNDEELVYRYVFESQCQVLVADSPAHQQEASKPFDTATAQEEL